MQEEFHHTLSPGFGRVRLNRCGVEPCGIDVHSHARLQEIHDSKTDDQRKRRQRLEVQNCFERHAADFFEIVHAGDAVHHCAENDRRDKHPDQPHEAVPQRLHSLTDLRAEIAEQNAGEDRRQHLHV